MNTMAIVGQFGKSIWHQIHDLRNQRQSAATPACTRPRLSLSLGLMESGPIPKGLPAITVSAHLVGDCTMKQIRVSSCLRERYSRRTSDLR